MRILFVLNSLDLGGAENYTVSLINSFDKEGHDVELRVLSNGLTLKKRLNPTIHLKVWSRKHSIDVKVLRMLSRDIISNKYHVVISSTIIYARLATMHCSQKILILYPIHSTVPLSTKYAIINYIQYKTRMKHEIFITSIKSQTDYLVNKYKLGSGFFQEIHNGIDTDVFRVREINFDKDAFFNSKGISKTDNTVLMVAGFRPEKRHVDALKAFKILKEKISSIKLIFIGNDSLNQKEKIEQVAKDMSEEVYFFSGVSEEDLLRFYWSSDIFTLTSDNETFPISALEAMATGLPCVLTNVGGVKDFLIPGFNGELVNANDPKSIMKAWRHALINRVQYNSIAIRQNIVNKYSIVRSIQNYIGVIEKYLS